MSDIQENLKLMKLWYGDDYAWRNQYDYGEVWQSAEGVKSFLDNIVIKEYIPNKVNNLLEIACGYGRVTKALKIYCNNLFGIDINQNCVDYCQKELFPQDIFKLTDGLTIPFDIQFDVIFSFDSLVHSDKGVVESYINEISKKLNPNGIMIIHHPCMGPHLDKNGNSIGGRGNATKALVSDYCINNGLTIINQIDMYLLPNGFYNDTFTIAKKEL